MARGPLAAGMKATGPPPAPAHRPGRARTVRQLNVLPSRSCANGARTRQHSADKKSNKPSGDIVAMVSIKWARRCTLAALSALALAAAPSGPALAQGSYVRLVVAFPAGGPSDLMASG